MFNPKQGLLLLLRVTRWFCGLCLCSLGGAHAQNSVVLTADELAYVEQARPVTMCVDPDWEPFEWIDGGGMHRGIAADLIRLVAERTGLEIVLFPTTTWEATLVASRAGECKLLSFLNQTPARDEWLIFTEPLFFDPNVIITHELHADIPDPAALHGKTVALPAGTMVKERIERDFPRLYVIPTESEQEAIALVSNRLADMTVRSLIVAAYTIKSEGLFNLKIAGRMPDYVNALRIGVLKDEVLLRDILDKGVATLTQADRDLIANRHAGVTFSTPIDYRVVWEIAIIALIVIVVLLLRQRHVRRIDEITMVYAQQQLEQERHAREEQSRMVAMLSHEIKTPLAMIDGAAQSLAVLMPQAVQDVSRRIDRIRRGVHRLETLTRQFLDKDRLEDLSLEIRSRRFELSALLVEVVTEIDEEHRVLLDVEPGLIAHGDPALLQLAVRNLVLNALKYSPPGSPVEVSGCVLGEQVKISVRDTGPGVPDSLRDKLFWCYVRGDHGDLIPGAGLGLYLAGRVAGLHGGQVRISNAATGAEFIFEWPNTIN